MIDYPGYLATKRPHDFISCVDFDHSGCNPVTGFSHPLIATTGGGDTHPFTSRETYPRSNAAAPPKAIAFGGMTSGADEYSVIASD